MRIIQNQASKRREQEFFYLAHESSFDERFVPILCRAKIGCNP